MTTLTITAARKNLGHWLRKAGQGEDIGIIDGDKIIALRPVQVESNDYAFREYGLTEDRLDHCVEVINAEVKNDRLAGKMKEYKGDLNALLED